MGTPGKERKRDILNHDDLIPAPSGGVPGRSDASKVVGPHVPKDENGKTATDRKIDEARRSRKVGNKFIDEGTPGDRKEAGDNFFEPAQRARLVSTYQQRVIVAQGACITACTNVKYDAVLAREDEIPVALSFALDFAGNFIGYKLGAALSALKGKGLAALTETPDVLDMMRGDFTDPSKGC